MIAPTRKQAPGRLWLWITGLAVASGCGYYSFTGASIPAHLNTIAIPIVEDNSASPVTALSETATRLLTDLFVGQTRLSLEPDEDEADVVLTARIDRYENAPASVSAEERAEINRVTITVSVRYFDRLENKEVLQRTFSSFGDYEPAVAGLQGEIDAAQRAMVNITNDIFTAATSNW